MTTTLVSAYYQIPNKRGSDYYKEHVRRFFHYFANRHIVFFCEQATKEQYKHYENVTFVVIPFSEIPIFKHIPMELWRESCALDPEKYHTPELGAIWACKKEFLRAACERTESEWLVWIDAGCVRTEDWRIDCENFTERRLQSLEPGIYMQLLHPLPKKLFYTFPDAYIAGAIMAAHRSYIPHFCDVFNGAIRAHSLHKVPFIMDQYVMAFLAVQELPWIHTICFDELDEVDRLYCVDSWFFFLMWL